MIKTVKLVLLGFQFVLMIFISMSCKTIEILNNKPNYISYYNEVLEIDSLWRVEGKEKLAVHRFSKLFEKYSAKNQNGLMEYENYIRLAEKHNMDFGGKKSLLQLIRLIAPIAHQGWLNEYFPLFDKYGIDSLTVMQELNIWQNELNKEYIDTMTIAWQRDQNPRFEGDFEQMIINDSLNHQMLLWGFEKHGFPSLQTIGIRGNNNTSFHISTMLLHLGSSIDDPDMFRAFRSKVYDYVISGDCPPEDYARMIDRHELSVKRDSTTSYYKYKGASEIVLDSNLVDRNRRNLGLPSLKYDKVIFLSNLKKKQTEK